MLMLLCLLYATLSLAVLRFMLYVLNQLLGDGRCVLYQRAWQLVVQLADPCVFQKACLQQKK